MRFYLIRHAAPEDGNADEPIDDPGLTQEGKETAAALGAWMVAKEEIPTVLYASPMRRTTETAEIIAEAIEDGGFSKPEVVLDVGIGPQMSIKGLVQRVAADKAQVRVGIVSHHESIEHGLRVLDREPRIHADIFAQGELRIVKVRRKDAWWDEHNRIAPSDLGLADHY